MIEQLVNCIKQINSSSLGLWASVITAIAALITAIINTKLIKNSEKQLIEMREQRELSQRPELMINSLDEVYLNKDTASSIRNYYHLTNDTSKFKEQTFLQLGNVGNGVAKNIYLSFYFEIEYLNSLLHDEFINENLEISFKDKYFSYSVENLLNRSFSTNNKVIVSIPYILGREDTKVAIPENIKDMVDIVCVVISSSKKKARLPRFSLEIKYKDSYDRLYKELISIYVDNIKYSINSDKTKTISYSLKPRKD